MTAFIQNYGWFLFWLLITVATVVIEALTTGLVSIWFTPGAFAAMVLSIFVDRFWVQVLVFAAISVFLLILGRTYFKAHPFFKKSEGFNADSYIGKTGIVQEEIDNVKETGSIKVNALVWTARTDVDGVTVPVGAVVTVVGISGVKLICHPVETK